MNWKDVRYVKLKLCRQWCNKFGISKTIIHNLKPMTQETKTKYALSFENKIFRSFGEMLKVFGSNRLYLTDFINSWSSVEDLDNYLIPDIEKVINDIVDLKESGSATISIDITKSEVIFYLDNVGTDYPTIPTTDFYEIVKAWKAFLLSPPLDSIRI